jgi:DNA-binding transcriptional LysR family regulator
MERVLGVRLLDRSRNGISPTPYGEAMLTGGLAAFDEIRQSIARIQHLARPTGGMLRIGCTQPLALGFVPSVVDRMRRSYPEVRFIVVEGNVATSLRQRRIDLAIGRVVPDARAPDLQEEVLFDDPVRIVAGAANPLSRRRKLSFDEVSKGPWALPPYDMSVGNLIVEGFRAHGLHRRRRRSRLPP